MYYFHQKPCDVRATIVIDDGPEITLANYSQVTELLEQPFLVDDAYSNRNNTSYRLYVSNFEVKIEIKVREIT